MSSLIRRIAQGKLNLSRRRLKSYSRPPLEPSRRAAPNRSIATANRWTGKPHSNAREMARRVRQATHTQ